MKLRRIEEEMFSQGYASVRMVAEKLRRNIVTIHRQLEGGEFKWKYIGHQKFVEISSVQKVYGAEGCKMLRLEDWSDLAES